MELAISALGIALLFLLIGFAMGRATTKLSSPYYVPADTHDPGPKHQEDVMRTDPFNAAMYGTMSGEVPHVR